MTEIKYGIDCQGKSYPLNLLDLMLIRRVREAVERIRAADKRLNKTFILHPEEYSKIEKIGRASKRRLKQYGYSQNIEIVE